MKAESEKKQTDLKNWVTKMIVDLVRQSKNNSLGFSHEEKAWSSPLVGFSNGNDPLYQFFKQDIGNFFWLPEEAFKHAYHDREMSADQLTVISWIIPQTKETKLDHRKQTEFPSERWARSRLYGEDFNNFMRQTISDKINAAGYPAFAPMLLPAFQRETSEKYGYASSWSERHAAFVAGLGTFGLSDGLITPLGKAIRCGTVIAKMDIEADQRSYEDHHAYCLYYFDGSCKRCADRCPADTITESGHDKVSCHDYIRNITVPYTEQEYQLKVTSCGLCQTKTPCESGIPPKIRKKLYPAKEV